MEVNQGTSGIVITFNEYELNQHDRELLESNKNKDKRIAELENELENARLSADFYMKSSTGYTDEFNKLKHENFELEDEIEQLRISLNTEHEDKHAAAKDALQLRKENAELKAKLENAIVPKFKIHQQVFYLKYNGINQGEILQINIQDSICPIIYEIEYLNNIQEEQYIFKTLKEAEEELNKRT